LIGQLSVKPFIKWLNFGQASNGQQNYNFGLWNYCNEVGGEVQNCQHPTPAYNWATAPGISQALPNQASSSSTKRTFMALFCLYFIGTGFSFLLWLASLSVCCVRRRACGVSMTTLIFINFLVMLAALICALVVTLRGIHLLSGAGQGWSGHAGYSMWMTIGAVVALFLSWLCYT
ncbi:actin cortical patch SUR7/pH-response regulator pali, partial [Syncephalastrum racemosum]